MDKGRNNILVQPVHFFIIRAFCNIYILVNEGVISYETSVNCSFSHGIDESQKACITIIIIILPLTSKWIRKSIGLTGQPVEWARVMYYWDHVSVYADVGFIKVAVLSFWLRKQNNKYKISLKETK